MNKKVIFLGLAVIAFVALLIFWPKGEKLSPEEVREQAVLSATYSISKDYLVLHYVTEKVLIEANAYESHDDWSKDLSLVIAGWNKLEKDAEQLEALAEEYSGESIGYLKPFNKISFEPIAAASAVTPEEINNVFDKAPAGQKIKTLAKHLGVDAKRAQLILNSTQAEIQAETWGEEGDVYRKLENTAVVVKDGCKVVGFVGAVALTGGTAGLAASGVVAKTAVVVSGVDLALEITEDGANMALGDKNKVAKIVGEVRSVTEPAASVLTIVNLPGNVSKGIEKLGVAAFTADQIRSGVQDGKVLGISIKSEGSGLKASLASMTEEELSVWLQKENISENNQLVQDILNIKNKTIKEALSVSEKLKTAKNNKAGPEEIDNNASVKNRKNVEEIDNNLEVGQNNNEIKDNNNNQPRANNSRGNSAVGPITTFARFEEITDDLMGQFYYDEETDEYISKRGKKGIRETFGAPDEEIMLDGYSTWIYYDLINNGTGLTNTIVFSFRTDDSLALTRWPTRSELPSLLGR